jgi:hypothetical protein
VILCFLLSQESLKLPFVYVMLYSYLPTIYKCYNKYPDPRFGSYDLLAPPNNCETSPVILPKTLAVLFANVCAASPVLLTIDSPV